MRIYLDNCCYNRPYDDQTQIRICLETQAKLYIQDMIKQKKFELVTSYVLDFENSNNRSTHKRSIIEKFIKEHTSFYISVGNEERIKDIAEPIVQTGIKEMDAYHLACAIIAECEYFITTDDRLLKYKGENISLVTPGEFIREIGGGKDA